MKQTKILTVKAQTIGEFNDLVNEINKNHNVFATQTHVTSHNGKLIYTAVLFTRVV